MPEEFEVQRDFPDLSDREVLEKYDEISSAITDLESEAARINHQLFLTRQQKAYLDAEFIRRNPEREGGLISN